MMVMVIICDGDWLIGWWWLSIKIGGDLGWLLMIDHGD